MTGTALEEYWVWWQTYWNWLLEAEAVVTQMGFWVSQMVISEAWKASWMLEEE